MPHLLSLLLETPAVAPASPAAIAGIVLSAVALIFSFWAFTRKESREDGQTLPQQLKALATADKTNAEAITKEHADRVYWQLENAADWERALGILKEFSEVQRQLAVIATTSLHHSAEIQRLNVSLESLTKHLNDFVLRLIRQTSA